MRVISVNVGLPREVTWKGRQITTGIFKEPREGRVRVGRLGLEGDRQADLSVHGGPSKAVYLYPIENYEYWRQELPGLALPWGAFGENLSVAGLSEAGVNVGDRFLVGSATLQITEPRMPCYKLAARFGRDDIVKRFMASGRTGFYAAVLEEGEVAAGDEIQRIAQDPGGLAIADVTRLYVRERDNRELLRRAVRSEALPESWRRYFRDRLEALAL